MTETDTEITNLWREFRTTSGKVTELETTMNLEIPNLKTSIGDLKSEMKDGFEGIGKQLSSDRTKREIDKERGWKLTTGLLVTGIGILMTILARLIFVSN